MNAKVILSRIDLLWAEVARSVRDAMVFMDDLAAECLHWHGGLKKLLESGARSVEMFSPFVKTDSNVKKVVFILMSPITGETKRTLMVIIRANNYRDSTVISSLPESCHSDSSLEVHQNFLILQNSILSWMGNMNYSSMVYHIPLFAAHLSHDLFIMPSFSRAFSIFKCGLMEMNINRACDTSLRNLPLEMQDSVKNLSQCLHSLFDAYQVKCDVFSVGMLSHIVGTEIGNLSQNQKKKAYSNKASVVIVDRLLDLAGPLSQSYQNMLDHILRGLPHVPGHVFDVCVHMNDLASCKKETVFGRPLLAPGCLAHVNNAAEIAVLNTILSGRPREALIEVNRHVAECAAKNELTVDFNSNLTAQTLKKRILAFKGNHKLIRNHCGLLQQALAIVQALEYSASMSSDKLSATQEALMQYLSVSSEEVLSSIMQMIFDKEKSSYKMEEILIFITFIYMLSGNTAIENESTLQATLMEAFFQDDELIELTSLFIDGELEDDSILDAVKTFFDVLKRLSSLRKGLKKYSNIFKSINPAFPATYNPFLAQLLEDIFDNSTTEIPDVEFHSAGLKDYLKTGFSLFMNVTKPQPQDNPAIFFIILGGITPNEIKIIREFSAKHKEKEIVIGCTNVVTPIDVLKDIGSIVKELSAEEKRNN